MNPWHGTVTDALRDALRDKVFHYHSDWWRQELTEADYPIHMQENMEEATKEICYYPLSFSM